MTNRRRLVNGRELYDMEVDKEQRRDIAQDHPTLVASLRAEYEEWWELCSEQFSRETPIVLGGDSEEVRLCSHDWRNHDCKVAVSQGQVREGVLVDGRWEIDVRAEGDYVFELHRWPREAGHAVRAGIDGDDVEWRRDAIAEQWHSQYTGGRALDIRRAALLIGSQQYSTTVSDDDDCASFSVRLAPGRTQVRAWFTNDMDGAVRGAYYVYVRGGRSE